MYTLKWLECWILCYVNLTSIFFLKCVLWLRQVFVTETPSLLAAFHDPPMSKPLFQNPSPKPCTSQEMPEGWRPHRRGQPAAWPLPLSWTFVLLLSHHPQNLEVMLAPEGCRAFQCPGIEGYHRVLPKSQHQLIKQRSTVNGLHVKMEHSKTGRS